MNDEVNKNKGSDRDMWGMRTTGRRAAAIVLAAVALVIQGCAIAPGQTMNSSGKLPEGKVVRVQELTTDLLNQLEAAHATEVRELAEQFAVDNTS